MTVDRAFVLGSDHGSLQEWGYVALSRASHATRLYITGAQVERDNHFQQLDDRDPLTRVSQALEQPGAERLAHDTHRPPPRPEPRSRPLIVRRSPAERELENAQARLRTLYAQELQARDLRDRAQRRIEEAGRQLADLGWRGRRQRGHELGRELAFQQRALTASEQTLTELEPERKRAFERVQLAAKAASALERLPVRQTRPERERQPSLDLGL